MKNTKMKELLQKLGTLMALAILVLIFCITMPDKFMKVGNFMNILKQASINCLIASGMLCALITAGIDLSVGSNCVLCTCTIGVMVQSGITNPFLLALCGLEPGAELPWEALEQRTKSNKQKFFSHEHVKCDKIE